MPHCTVSIEGYRSVRKLHLPFEPVSIFVGANGVGKTNRDKALDLPIDRAALNSRNWIGTPCETFAAALQEETGKQARRVVMRAGTTAIPWRNYPKNCSLH